MGDLKHPLWTNPVTGRLISPHSITAKKLIKTGVIDYDGHSLIAPSQAIRGTPDPSADALAARVHALEMERLRVRLAHLEAATGLPGAREAPRPGRPPKNPTAERPRERKSVGRFTVDATDVSAAETTDAPTDTDTATDAPTSDDDEPARHVKKAAKAAKQIQTRPAKQIQTRPDNRPEEPKKKTLAELLAEISPPEAAPAAAPVAAPHTPFNRRWR